MIPHGPHALERQMLDERAERFHVCPHCRVAHETKAALDAHSERCPLSPRRWLRERRPSR